MNEPQGSASMMQEALAALDGDYCACPRCPCCGKLTPPKSGAPATPAGGPFVPWYPPAPIYPQPGAGGGWPYGTWCFTEGAPARLQ